MAEQDLERKLIDDIKAGKEVDLERALLIASGLKTEDEVAEYVGKIDTLQEQFWDEIAPKRPDPFDLSVMLFDFLWRGKEERYCLNYLLTNAIDAQLSEDENQGVGSCLGLTTLYSVLGLREGLDLSILASGSNALSFLRNHVLSLLRVDGVSYAIENAGYCEFEFLSKKYAHFKEQPVNSLIRIFFFSNGVTKAELGDFEAAIDYYNKTIEIDPNSSDAYNNRGIAKERLGDLDGALEDYNKAIELDPDDTSAYNNCGNIKLNSGDLAGALWYYNHSIMLDSKNGTAYNNRGNIKYKVGELIEALRDYDKAIELHPEDDLAYRNRGDVKRDLRDLDGAVMDYDKAIELDPNDIDAYTNRGNVKKALGELEEANKDSKKAEELEKMQEGTK